MLDASQIIAGESSTATDSCGRLPVAAKSSGASGSGSSDEEPTTKKPSGVGSAQALTRGDIEDTCNTQRASIIVNPDGEKYFWLVEYRRQRKLTGSLILGTKECVCAAEWTGPPSCTGFPWWKIALTVGGAVAAAVSA